MNLATDMGCHSGRATPSLHDTPYRNNEETIGRQSTYLLPITVQTNRTTSDFNLSFFAPAPENAICPPPLMPERYIRDVKHP